MNIENALTLWHFTHDDSPEFSRENCDVSCWKQVHAPHDWAIEGPIDAKNDCYSTQIKQDGELTETMHYGRTGSLPHVGIGWYRTCFKLESSAQGGRQYLVFDGVMSHAAVFVNGKKLAYRPFGYSSFTIDFTDVAKYGEDAQNVVAVRVENLPRSSRWYPGAGLIREVRILQKNSRHIAPNGVWLFTENIDIDAHTTVLHVNLKTVNADGCTFKASVCDASEKEVAYATFTGENLTIPLKDVAFWSPESPVLYKVRIQMLHNNVIEDELEEFYGFRKVEFDGATGMKLNGKRYFLKGVCLHHDHGPIGAAFNISALERQLRLLKGIGVNAIRTSHNPPDPHFPILCDKLGIALIDEAFDAWENEKCPNDYSTLFKEWHERDLVDFIVRDRNRPSVFLWSIGNEVPEQYMQGNRGSEIARELVAICHQTDPTRPVTIGLDAPKACMTNGIPQELDVVGWNYRPQFFDELHAVFPNIPQLGTETASTVSTRDEFLFPVEEAQPWQNRPGNLQCSDYALEYPGWATTPDTNTMAMELRPWLCGDFVWSGFDYLGEPTPFNNEGPAHSSYFGIFDLVGLPKARAWFYAAAWTDAKVLHIVPHWTFAGREGLCTPVHVFTNLPKAELFLNGKSQGIRMREQHMYRLRWDDVIYQPGELKVVGYDENGAKVATDIVRTAGKPVAIKLEAEAQAIPSGNARQLAYLTVSVVDANGIVQPNANHSISFEVSGEGGFAAAGNGDPTSQENFMNGTMSAFHGKCVAIVCATGKTGTITITAKAEGLPPATAIIQVI